MGEINNDYQDGHWEDITGYFCSWCGRQTELRYIFPIVLHRGDHEHHEQQIQGVCLECIAKSPITGAGAFTSDLPIYDKKGNRT